MKIIKQGKFPRPTERLYRGTCPQCDCIIEVTENEVVYCQYGELPDKFNGVCPTAGCNYSPIYVNRVYRPPIDDGDNELPVHPGWVGQRGGMIMKGQCPP